MHKNNLQIFRVKALIAVTMNAKISPSLNQFNNLHFHLGLTRSELKKRLEMGLIDPEVLNRQIHESAKELKLNALCERWIDQNFVDQIDKHTVSIEE
jgi:hypothetical protein